MQVRLSPGRGAGGVQQREREQWVPRGRLHADSDPGGRPAQSERGGCHRGPAQGTGSHRRGPRPPWEGLAQAAGHSVGEEDPGSEVAGRPHWRRGSGRAVEVVFI